MMYGGIEAGGTKFNCIIASSPSDVAAFECIATTTPEETLRRVVDFFRTKQMPLHGIGIGSFGPVDLDRRSQTFGHITSTPKPGWQNVDVAGFIEHALNVAVTFDTDVNAAAVGEHRWGAAQGLDTFVYLTIGTGIGGGGMVSKKLMHGLIHPEMGHMRIPHDFGRDPYLGCCPFHGDCLEGLASGPALRERWSIAPESLPDTHPAWDLEAHYLAHAVANIVCTLSPLRVILGGGVMAHAMLLPMIREKTKHILNGYIASSAILEHIDDYIVSPRLGNQAGVLGALALNFYSNRSA